MHLTIPLITMALMAPSVASAADPVTCQGYPEARVFLEAQSWWRTTPGKTGTDHGHGHFGACVPLNQTIRGVMHIDWVAKLHDNPGYIKDIVQEVAIPSSNTSGTQTKTTPRYACPTADCTFVIPTDFDTTKVPTDGVEGMKARMRIAEPDGHTMRPSLRFPARLANGGRPVKDSSRSSLFGYGWYGSSNDNNVGPKYAYARFLSPVPTAPLSGKWTFNVSFEGDEAHISDNVTRYFVSIDPAFHATPPYEGKVVYAGSTSCTPFGIGCDGPSNQPITVDTSTLAPGPHKLFLRTDEDDSTGSTNSGVLVIPFVVG
jgi:hypothetical protein